MVARKITSKDYLIWRLLQDPDWRVSRNGQVETRMLRGSTGRGPWRRAGWISPSRNGEKLYRRVQYQGEELYEHRIVFAALNGRLSPYKTVNHKNLLGCANHPRNLELVTPAENLRHARAAYRQMGMSAAEAKAAWIRGAGEGRQFNWRGQHGAYSHSKT